MPQDHAGPIENSGAHTAGKAEGETKRITTLRRIFQGAADEIVRYAVAGLIVVLVGFLGSATWNTVTLPARLDAERELSDERFAAELKRSDERFEAERALSDERFNSMLRQLDHERRENRRQLDEARRENKELLNLLRENSDLTRENKIRIEILKNVHDGIQ